VAAAEVGVVASKLIPHRRPRGSVSRPRLVERLNAGREQALTLVSAPAGFGKTTLLAEWVGVADTDIGNAWVSLDSGDREAVRLWTHIIAAFARSRPGFGARSLAALRADPTRIVESLLPVLFDELSEQEGQLVLTLDDYHLAESKAIDEQLQSFLSYRPPRVQLVVSTRSDPALGIARLRASGELVELRAHSLKFDMDELPEFFEGLGSVDSVSSTCTDSSSVRADGRRRCGWPPYLSRRATRGTVSSTHSPERVARSSTT
jgi:LuxR family maltose regulon positive regulatory protein